MSGVQDFLDVSFFGVIKPCPHDGNTNDENQEQTVELVIAHEKSLDHGGGLSATERGGDVQEWSLEERVNFL